MLYSTVPVVPVAVTVIVPSVTPQFVGSVEATVEIVGNTGAVIITSASVVTQVPSIFLTLIWYVPADKPVNEPD